MPRRGSAISPTWRKRLGAYKEDLLKAALLSIPLALVAQANELVRGRLVGQPWQAIWFLIPVAIGVFLLRQRAIRRHAFTIDGRVLAFVGAYVLLFTMASQTSVLDISRELSAFGAPASRRWATPVSWGDWRYRLVPRVPERDRMLVVLLRPGAGRSLLDARKEILDLVTLARQQQASGLALDVYFRDPSPLDPLLCQAITAAAASMPVLIGYGFEIRDGAVVEFGVPPSLESCLPRTRLAHLAGFIDIDRVSRLTPLYFRGDSSRPALGLAVARSVATTMSPPSTLALPGDGLLRWVAPPAGQPRTIRLDAVQSGKEDANLLRGRFVMAGESDYDSFETPFGRQPGIVIHSWVAHSLLEGHAVQRHSWWLGFAITLVFCYGMTVWVAHGASVRDLLTWSAGATILVLVLAVVSILTGPYWFDVVYPLAAIWLLLPALLGFRRLAV